jgi:hypothetical protein
MPSQNKTQQTDASVEKFLDSISDDKKREDSKEIVRIMQEMSGYDPKMWGSIIGFGKYHYKYESGREGDFMLVGFSPRKQNLTLYIMPGFDKYEEYMKKLGKYSIGRSCLYIKNLEDIDVEILKKLIKDSVDHMKKTNEVID